VTYPQRGVVIVLLLPLLLPPPPSSYGRRSKMQPPKLLAAQEVDELVVPVVPLSWSWYLFCFFYEYCIAAAIGRYGKWMDRG